MIKIISSIHVKTVAGDITPWLELPLIPATGEYTENSAYGEEGRTTLVTITARLYRLPPILSRDLIVRIGFASDFTVVGTTEVPVRFTNKYEGTKTITAEYTKAG